MRGQGKTLQSKRFTVQEEGILRQLASVGLTDSQIGEVHGRPAEDVEKKRTKLFG